MQLDFNKIFIMIILYLRLTLHIYVSNQHATHLSLRQWMYHDCLLIKKFVRALSSFQCYRYRLLLQLFKLLCNRIIPLSPFGGIFFVDIRPPLIIPLANQKNPSYTLSLLRYYSIFFGENFIRQRTDMSSEMSGSELSWQRNVLCPKGSITCPTHDLFAK